MTLLFTSLLFYGARWQTGNGAKLSLFGGANKACVAGAQKG